MSAKALRSYRYGKGNMQIHYALKSPPRWKAGADLDKVALLHLTPGLDGVSRAANECERGLLPAVPTICVGQPTAFDPSRAPEGKAILWLQLPEAPRHHQGRCGRASCRSPQTANGPRNSASAFADRVERILESHIDGWSENRHRPQGLFAGRSRDDEHEPRRRRSLWRLLRRRPVLRLAPVQVVGEPQDPCAGPLPYRRLDPSRPRPRRRLGLQRGEEAGRMNDETAHLRPARRNRPRQLRALPDEPHHGPLQRRPARRDGRTRADHAQDAGAGGTVGGGWPADPRTGGLYRHRGFDPQPRPRPVAGAAA